ncbi:MAG: oligosaccharide flippase family protein [Bacteroidales bacterium]|nr:oligosaccharide flippase family protein [Bacteroidales bacterium]
MDNASGNIKKSLLSGLFWVLLANLIVKPFWLLVIEMGVQNSVGAEMYGFYFDIFSISYIFNILLDLGITNFNTRNIAQHPKLISKHLSGILSIKIMLLALYAVITFSTGALLGYDSSQFRLLGWLTLNQFLNSLILYLRSNFEGLLLFKWDSLLSVMDRLLMIAICGLMLWAPQLTLGGRQFTVFHFVYAQTAAYVVTAAVALAVLVRKTGLRRLRWDKPFTLAILKKSLPFALLVLLMASYNRIDPVMLRRLSPDGLGNFNAGIYAGAFRLLDALTMIVYLVSVPLLPIYSKLTKGVGSQSKTPDELRSITTMMFSLVMVFAVTAACALSSVGRELMAFFYDDNAVEYSAVFRILVFCIVPISASYVFGTLLTAAGRLKQLNILAAISLAINLVINALCIPRWGAVGSAWAAIGAQSFMALAEIATAIKIFRLKPSPAYILKLAFFTLLIIGCTLCVPQQTWWIALTITALASIGLALLLGLVDKKEIVKTFRK